MGGVATKHLEELPPLGEKILAIFLSSTGTLTLINVPPPIRQIIRDQCVRKDSHVSMEMLTKELFEIKFQRNPFSQYLSAEHSSRTKLMFVNIHSELEKEGWYLTNAPVLVNRVGLSCWIFVKTSAALTTPNNFVAISMTDNNILQFIDCPFQLTEYMAKKVQSEWQQGVYSQSKLDTGEYQVVLKGDPWESVGEESIQSRSLIVSLINTMHNNGFILINSTSIRSDSCDCMFFTSKPDKFESDDSNYFMMSLRSDDHIVFIGADSSMVSLLTKSFKKHWGESKVFKEYSVFGFPCIQFSGNPWLETGDGEMKVKMVFCHLLQDLSNNGWRPAESIDCSKKMVDKSSLVFSKAPSTRLRYIALVPSRGNQLNVVNAPVEILHIIRDQINKNYTPGISSETSCSDGWQIIFNHNPNDGMDTNASLCYHHTILACLSALFDKGWDLLLSADLSSQTNRDHPIDTTFNTAAFVNPDVYALAAQTLFLANAYDQTDC